MLSIKDNSFPKIKSSIFYFLAFSFLIPDLIKAITETNPKAMLSIKDNSFPKIKSSIFYFLAFSFL
ncbi:hypothetical protein, partial [Faecalibacillus intestinalis]|uniref:hypothetical protein n=1 Tax=Faecalibacillus intestinalis TaxID=1982626 RepID=UPI002FD94B8F